MLSKQVLYDLDILSHTREKECLFDRLNHCKTDGGKNALMELCQLKDITQHSIIQRQLAIKHIYESLPKWQFTVTKSELFYTEQYFNSNYAFIATTSKVSRALLSFNKLLINKSQYYYVLSGAKQVLLIIEQIRTLCFQVYNSALPPLLKELLQKINGKLQELNINEQLFNIFKNEDPSPILVFEIDEKLRRNKKEALNELIELYYELEALFSLAVAHKGLQLTFPVFNNERNGFTITDLKHPLISNCVANSISMAEGKNILIITGPNMAGKSTFMKSIGLAFFMANLGIGIASSAAEIPVIEQIVTSINTEDDIGKGYSYFFNEVQNVKNIAITLKLYIPAMLTHYSGHVDPPLNWAINERA